MKLPVLCFVTLIVNVSVHSQLSVVPYSNFANQSVQSHGILDNYTIVRSDIFKRTEKNLKRMASASIDSLIKWQQIYGPFGSTVRCFARAANGTTFFCSEGGIYRSKSFGGVWEKLALPKSFDYRIMQTMYIHPNGTILAFGNSQIYRSTDNGNTWTVNDIKVFIEQVVVDSSGNLYGASFDAGVYFSDDIGLTWKSIGLIQKNLFSLIITETGKLICGSLGALYTSVDNGARWDSLALGGAPFYSLVQNYMGAIYALADDELFKSTDNGTTWVSIVQSPSLMYRFYEDEQLSLYILDMNGIHISSDGGNTWNRMPISNRFFLCMNIVNKDTLMTGTFDGVYVSVDGGASWKNNDSGLVSLNIASITGTHAGDLVVSAGKQIYKSSDQGRHWQSKYSSQDLGRVLAVDADENLYVADKTSIRRSSDNGESWNEIIVDSYNYYFTAAVISAAQTFFAGTGNGEILRFVEGGRWEKIFVDNRRQEIKAIIIDQAGNVFCATSNSVFKSMDNGTTWKEIFHSSDASIVSAIFYTDKYLFAGTYYDGIFRSADGGITWEPNASISPDDPIVGMACNKEGVLFALGIMDIYKSMDMGTNWTSNGNGLPLGINNNICITKNGDLYVGTQSNGIYTSMPIVTTVVTSNREKSYNLDQNFPNPFNPSTTISFSLPTKSFVSLKIFDLMGRNVATIVAEELSAGSYQRQWNASMFSSGVYFYSLQAGSFTETKHLLLLK